MRAHSFLAACRLLPRPRFEPLPLSRQYSDFELELKPRSHAPSSRMCSVHSLVNSLRLDYLRGLSRNRPWLDDAMPELPIVACGRGSTSCSFDLRRDILREETDPLHAEVHPRIPEGSHELRRSSPIVSVDRPRHVSFNQEELEHPDPEQYVH